MERIHYENQEWWCEVLAGLLDSLRQESVEAPGLTHTIESYELLLRLKRHLPLPDPQPFSLKEMVSQLRRSFSASGGTHPESLVILFREETSSALLGQKELIYALLYHLAALTLNRSGHGAVCMRLEVLSAPYRQYDAQLLIRIEDSGVPLQRRLLRSWLNDTTKDSVYMTESSISWQLIPLLFNALQGRANAESRPNEGLEIAGWLPLSFTGRPPKTLPLPESIANAASPIAPTQPNILLMVENVPAHAAHLQRCAKEAGCLAFIVPTHSDLLLWAAALPCSAIFLNTRLTDEKLSVVRQLNYRAGLDSAFKVPLFAIIDNKSSRQLPELKQLNVNTFLNPPITATAIARLSPLFTPSETTRYMVRDEEIIAEYPPSITQHLPQMMRLFSGQIDTLKQLLSTDNSDAAEISEQAHSVRSTALSLGYFHLSTLMNVVEQTFRKHHGMSAENRELICHCLSDVDFHPLH